MEGIRNIKRSGGLLYFISMYARVSTELANGMVTLGEPGVY